MQYRTTLQKHHIEYIRNVYDNNQYYQKSQVARELKEKYDDLSELTLEAVRKRVAYLILQFDEEEERGEAMNTFAENQGMVAKNIQSGWVHNYDKDGKKIGTYFVKNPQLEEDMKSFVDEVIQEMKRYAPVYPVLEREEMTEGHLLVVDPADLHIGKLCSELSTGENYNSSIAVKRCLEGVKGILDKAKGFNIEHILFIGGNDVLHIDNPRRTTTSGTPQDTDGMRHDNYLIAQKLYVEVLEILMTVADVTFHFCPSNHDYTNGFFLCNSIETWFRNCEHITFDNNLIHRKYFTYGKNLIGVSHGDGAKEKDLPLLMSVEAKEDWSSVDHRYWYLHHMHHKISKDYIGCTIEYLRSPSGTDRRHSDNGYTGVPKAIEGFIHHKDYGQIARLTHIFS